MFVRTLLVALIALFAAAAHASARSADLKVGSFNIRYANDGDGDNAWRHRRGLVVEVLRGADFWGLQEALPGQVAELSTQLPEYGVIARTRESDPLRGEACPILYRKDRWEPDAADFGTFWLSESPDAAGSRSWDAALPRIATFARFTERGGDRAVYVFNTHFDHKGEVARARSARLLVERIVARASPDPVIVLGDFNAGPRSAPIATLLGDPVAALRDAWRCANPEAPEQGTFNGWRESLGAERIDFVFFSAGLSVREAAIDGRRPDGRWPSDHAPVASRLAFAGPFKAEVQRRAVWAFDEESPHGTVRIDNRFSGARVNSCTRLAPFEYRVVTAPENEPINPSPSYGFRVRAEAETDITVRIAFAASKSRPWPWISRDGRSWARMESREVVREEDGRELSLRVRCGPEPVWVASHALVGIAEIETWTDSVSARAGGTPWEIGRSAAGRPIRAFEFGAHDARHAVVVIGRQHPPEVTGSLGMMRFIEAMLGDGETAREFRSSHRVLCVPLVNPDGVHEGHWRSTLGAVDANRDWHDFSQPETRAVRDAVAELASREGSRIVLLLDFHTTSKDILYVPPEAAVLEPAAFSERWLAAISRRFPDYHLESSATNNVDQWTFKRWAFETYGAPGITYEVGSGTPHARIAEIVPGAAEEAMRLLVEHARAVRAESAREQVVPK